MHISTEIQIDERTIRGIEGEAPGGGKSWYGIAIGGGAWTWTVYNGDPVLMDEESLRAGEHDTDHVLEVADQVEFWDHEHAAWLRAQVEDEPDEGSAP